ncbi:MAG: ribosome-associated translation inhibitor RaiA [Rickettsiales bacterium]|nr:ribosome-associated translation inhibitor RaiA [Rickettsiales bacterium]
MIVNINSNFSLGMHLPDYVKEKVNKEILKYFDTTINTNVFFSKNGNFFKTNIVVNEGSKRGIIIKSTAESDDIYNSFDLSLAKITKQLRKHKGKMRNYRKKISDLKAKNNDLPYILADRFILKEAQNENLEEEVVEVGNEKEIVYDFNIIEEKETEIEELTVSEALMKMDLINLPAYMFINKENGQVNVVYKRNDGNVTWINPRIK